MHDQVQVAYSSLFAEYAASHNYHVYGYRERYYAACFCDGGHVAKGHRTGEVVAFKRRSDAERFVDARNRICQNAASVPVSPHGSSYSPALLLDARLSAAITDDPVFRPACEWGFGSFLGDIWDDEPAFYMECGAREFVHGEMLEADPVLGLASLAVRVGVVLGWLSALALTQYEEAKEGLQELMELLERL